MNLFSACIRLGIWNITKARAEVWSMSNLNTDNKLLSELLDIAKKSFKKLAMDHHPDRGGDNKNFIEIQEAYDIIKNATVGDFINSLDDEKKSSIKYFDPGSDNCKACNRWSNVIDMCITVTCSGFDEPPKRKLFRVKGQTEFAT